MSFFFSFSNVLGSAGLLLLASICFIWVDWCLVSRAQDSTTDCAIARLVWYTGMGSLGEHSGSQLVGYLRWKEWKRVKEAALWYFLETCSCSASWGDKKEKRKNLLWPHFDVYTDICVSKWISPTCFEGGVIICPFKEQVTCSPPPKKNPLHHFPSPTRIHLFLTV